MPATSKMPPELGNSRAQHGELPDDDPELHQAVQKLQDAVGLEARH